MKKGDIKMSTEKKKVKRTGSTKPEFVKTKPTEVVYLDNEGKEKLQAEIEELQNRIDAEVLGIANIDRKGISDIFDYEDAQRRVFKLQSRVAQKRDMLRRAVIVKKMPTKDLVSLGDIVSANVEIEDDSFEVEFKLVAKHTPNIDAETPEYTINSLLGKAVHGKRTGEVVSYVTPENKVAYVTINGINLTKEDSQKQL